MLAFGVAAVRVFWMTHLTGIPGPSREGPLVLILLLMLPTGSVPGQKDDLEGLFRELYQPVLGFFTRRGCAPEKSEEMAQETFLRVFRGLDQFRGESKASTWVFSIATNLWRTEFRDGKAAKRDGEEVSISHQEPLLPASDERPLEVAMSEERRRLLRGAVEGLPRKMRQCVKLRIYQDRSFREIAAILGVSEQTAKSQVSLAKRKLRSILAGKYPELESEPGSEA